MDLLLRVGPWALCIQVKLYQQLLTLALTHGGINYVVHVLQEKQHPNCRFVSYVEKMIFKRICFFLTVCVRCGSVHIMCLQVSVCMSCVCACTCTEARRGHQVPSIILHLFLSGRVSP